MAHLSLCIPPKKHGLRTAGVTDFYSLAEIVGGGDGRAEEKEKPF